MQWVYGLVMTLVLGLVPGHVPGLGGMTSVASASLADRVPEDAIFYIGWEGAEPRGEAFEASHLHQLLEESQLRQVLGESLPATLRRIAEDQGDADMAMVADAVERLAPMLWDRPWGLYFAGVDPQMGMPRLGLLVGAGDYEAEFNNWLDRLHQMGVPIQAVNGEGYIGGVLDMAWQEPADGGLAASDRFAEAVGPLREQDDASEMLLTYIDAKGVMRFIEQMGGMDAALPPGQPQPPVEQVMRATGLDGVEHVAFSAGFDGPLWYSRAFVATPAPRRGLMAWLMDSDPLEAGDLELVPATATWFAAGRFDLGDFLDATTEALAEVDPDAAQEMRQALAMAGMIAGVDIEQGILRAAGPAWVLHRDAQVAGPGSFMGLTLVNEPRDPQALGEALQQLSEVGSRMAGPSRQGEPSVRFVELDHRDATIHSIAFIFVSPSWAIDDGRLYVGLMPQAVANAIDHARDGGPSILENEQFQIAHGRLGERLGATLSFTDLPRIAPAVYGNTMMFGQILPTLMVMLDDEADPRPLMMIPTLGRLQPLLEPTGQVTWTDEAGWHAHGLSPFPGAELLGHENSGAPAMFALSTATLLPALSRAREAANRTVSGSNARSIVQSMIIYAALHDGVMPDDIGVLIEEGHLVVDPTVSPGAPVQPPAALNQRHYTERADWVRQHASYVLIPDRTRRDGADVAVLFERPEHSADGEHLAVAFADGHVESLPIHEAVQLIEDQTGQTLHELLERQQDAAD